MKVLINRFKQHNYYIKEIVGLLFVLIGIYFLRQQREELINVKETTFRSDPFWIVIGIGGVFLYVLLQALMYVHSFKTVGKTIAIKLAVHLFLKRNLLSVFLPGGGITSLAFFTKEIERTGISKTKINFASYIYGIVGIISIVLLAFPVILYISFTNQGYGGEWETLIVLCSLLFFIGYFSYDIYIQGRVYRWLSPRFPALEAIILELKNGRFSKQQLGLTLLYSILIELVGIIHLIIAMKALHLQHDVSAAIVGYVIATLFLCISPFMRGLGAVEVSLVVVLNRFGFNTTESLSVTFLYRLFEFWLPLLLGLFSFIFQKGNLILRIFPSVLLFTLGIVNIASVLTPAIASRVKTLHRFIPNDTIHFSNYMVLLIGLLLLICSAFLIKGLRNAWMIALLLSTLSFIGHLTKAIDYEEASLALFTIVTLLITYKQYYIKGDKKLQTFSITTSFVVIGAVLIYGTIGFYLLKANHFHEDFSIIESFVNTLACLILVDTTYLNPHTEFAKLFVYSINLFGALAILMLFYSFIQPYIFKTKRNEEELKKAQILIANYGKSATDYFKLANDKLFFFPENIDAVISYKIANSFAVVLQDPVCLNSTLVKEQTIRSFEGFCQQNSLKAIYYRVDEDNLAFYRSIKKKALPIGQEAIVNLSQFSLEGKSNKSLRNALNNIEKRGFISKIYAPPIKDGILQKLKSVSDEWLMMLNREEMIFSQGAFDERELKEQTIITLENADEKVVSFLNVIPDYMPGEITYDLIRKTADAPGGNMDCILITLIQYARQQGFESLNMGLAPFSGIDSPTDIPQRTIKFAYEKLQQFKHYKGLREFKDKYNPTWHTKYLIYSNDYDLLHIPLALNKVMKA
ncbi:phosphatidylglycerol lysyltransferase domain-containing protein [Olivibacter sp. CPCC 100613]|uniref:phosphatidylglycerol lysyltransferase domain-containing protein n=1 Tax=Olivibacter sp. CPCC 100613 TaxID=3079931 RepID=UPI002FF8A0A6